MAEIGTIKTGTEKLGATENGTIEDSTIEECSVEMGWIEVNIALQLHLFGGRWSWSRYDVRLTS